jgi:serine/threonine protein kinase
VPGRQHRSRQPRRRYLAAGLLLYELFTGQKPFADPSDLHRRQAIFPVAPSQQTPNLPPGFDDWLQRLCTFAIPDRPTAKQAWTELKGLIRTAKAQPVAPPPPPPEPEPALDYRHLAPDTQLGRKYRVQSKLGEGSFGVVYKVIDTLADRTIAMKIILRESLLRDRTAKERIPCPQQPARPSQRG